MDSVDTPCKTSWLYVTVKGTALQTAASSTLVLKFEAKDFGMNAFTMGAMPEPTTLKPMARESA
jgi:hypothetical protein